MLAAQKANHCFQFSQILLLEWHMEHKPEMKQCDEGSVVQMFNVASMIYSHRYKDMDNCFCN